MTETVHPKCCAHVCGPTVCVCVHVSNSAYETDKRQEDACLDCDLCGERQPLIYQ